MKYAVNYLMSGAAHMPYLVVSLRSLRNWWDGEIFVYCWPESYEIGLKIAKDFDLAVSVKPRNPVYRGKNDQFIDKIVMMQKSGLANVNLYLDADTMITGDIRPILDSAVMVGFAATQFNDWTTYSGIIKNRVSRLIGNPQIDRSYVTEVLEMKYPSLNGGVFAAHVNSPVLPQWYDWTMAAKDIFIADETVLHILQAKFSQDQFSVLSHCNISPKHKAKSMPDEGVRIWHFHGDSNVRPEKSQKGFDMWWPVFKECLHKNVGRMQEWIDLCGNKYIRRLMDASIGN